MDKEKLVLNIKKYCVKKGMTISQLESNLNFSMGLISRWTRVSPSIEKILAVADLLGVSLDDLVGRNENEEEESFIKILLKVTSNGELLWSPYRWNIFSYPIQSLKEIQGLNWISGYCEYETSFFLLVGCLNEEDGSVEDIGLYILPDEDAAPVYQQIDIEELVDLYELISEDITWKEDIKRSEKIKEGFLKTMGNER